MASDKRKMPRFKINRKVLIRLSNGDVVTTRACDISEDGIGIICPYNADVGSKFDIFFDLLGDVQSGLVKARAQVCFVNLVGTVDEFRIGMQFIHMDDNSKDIVSNYIKRRQSQPGWI